ncbi:zinc finger protein 541-like isoform X2 [Anomalospiza imberbis]|uniref:zinc finger protein 541-like isoform X2 n=1 Tax=Anomalospiza imberbis TaxID=187417 RepID=UPI00358E94D5
MPQWEGPQSKFTPEEVTEAKVAHPCFCPLGPVGFCMECWAVPVATVAVSCSCGRWTLVEQRWSSSCRICSWAVPDQLPSGLSTRSGLWIDILISLSAARHPHSALGLSKVERRVIMKRKAKANNQPHINVGSDFQAELPELQTRPPSEDEEEPATLVWKPWGEDDSDMEKPDRVRELLDMASSRGIPGAAANLELALHCLHQACGSVPEALEMLLSGGPPTAQGHPLADYHYAGSDTWTPEEKESFQKAFHTYGKDFHLIQKQIQSKTVAQCVEYYYSWKKEHKPASALAQVSGNEIQTCQEGQETGRRGQNLLVSHARHPFARITLSYAMGKAQQMLPRASLCCCPEILEHNSDPTK